MTLPVNEMTADRYLDLFEAATKHEQKERSDRVEGPKPNDLLIAIKMGPIVLPYGAGNWLLILSDEEHDRWVEIWPETQERWESRIAAENSRADSAYAQENLSGDLLSNQEVSPSE